MNGIQRARRVLAAAAIGFASLGIITTEAGAQQQPPSALPLIPGARVRVTAKTLVAPLVANFMQMRADTAVFIEEGSGRGIWSIATSDIVRIEVSDGEKKTNRPYVTRGAIYGGIGGAVVGFTFAAVASPSDSSRKYGRLTNLGIGAVAGAVVGGLIGSRFALERWRPVPLRQVSIAPNGRGFSVSIGF